jgi:hypothetical protein
MSHGPSDEDVALRLFEYTRGEREKMLTARKNIDALLNGGRIQGTDYEKELSTFVGHLGNIKGLMPERYQRLSELKIKQVRLYEKIGGEGFREAVGEDLDEILAYPIDYKSKLWKRISAQIMSHGFGAGASVER